MELLATVIIHKYVRSVEVSKSRRATYYAQGENLPPKYATRLGLDYQWVQYTDGIYLADAQKKPIVKNPNSAGKPRNIRINGQDLHQLTLTPPNRSKIIKAIKEQMIPEIAKLEPITKLPIRILMELHDTFMDMEYIKLDGQPKEIDWDCDNRGLHYAKVFPDVLQGCLIKDEKTKKLVPTSKVIIPNDSRRFITQPPVALFVPIEDTNQRKLVFKIYHDDRDVIKNSKFYQ